VASAIDRLRRASDLAIRWGGDEFLVLLPDVDQPASQTFAERVRTSIENLRAGPVRLSISAGVGQLTASDSLTATLVEVDRRLYDAKHSGGNTVR
jgi:diguanylate cyclase (GGDEF)-like protein